MKIVAIMSNSVLAEEGNLLQEVETHKLIGTVALYSELVATGTNEDKPYYFVIPNIERRLTHEASNNN